MTSEMSTTNYAARAALRRELTFALPPHDSAVRRAMDTDECTKLLQQAACLAVRAGNADVANGALSLLARLEAR